MIFIVNRLSSLREQRLKCTEYTRKITFESQVAVIDLRIPSLRFTYIFLTKFLIGGFLGWFSMLWSLRYTLSFLRKKIIKLIKVEHTN